MSRIIICSFLFFALFSSCSNKKNFISFGYFECFILSKNEKQIPITEVQLDFYRKHLSLDSSNLILNRVIAGGELNTYISMSATNINLLIDQFIQSDSSLKVINKKKFSEAGKDFTSYFLKIDNYYLNRIVYCEIQLKNTVVIDYLGNDSSTIATYYKNHNLFIHKINCND